MWLLQERALIEAAKEGDCGRVRCLLDNGVSVNMGVGRLGSPLHTAAFFGNLEVAELLIERGAEISAATYWSKTTPIHYAAQLGRTRVVKLLLAKGADPFRIDSDGMTSLHLAVKGGKMNIVKMLLAAGLNPFQKDKNSETPLSLAIAGNKMDIAKLFRSQDPGGKDKVRILSRS